MLAEVSQPVIEPEDLLRMEAGHRFDLVGGRLVEKIISQESDRVALRLGHRLDSHVDLHRLGVVLGSKTGYQIFPWEPMRVRFPDGSFIGKVVCQGARSLGGIVASCQTWFMKSCPRTIWLRKSTRGSTITWVPA
jgi:hypothetical protein